MSEEARKAAISQCEHSFNRVIRNCLKCGFTQEYIDGWNAHAEHTAAIREKALALLARLAKVFTDCEGLAYDHDIDNELTALKAALEGNDEDTDA